MFYTCCTCRRLKYSSLREKTPPATPARTESREESAAGAQPQDAQTSARPRLLTQGSARTAVDAAAQAFGLDSPEAIIARNNLVGALLARGGHAGLEEAHALAAAVSASLEGALGEQHPAAQLGRSNAAAAAAALKALTAPPPEALVSPSPPLPPSPLSDPAALLNPLSGRWLIDEGASQNMGALLLYFGAPWLLVRAVTAGATPPLVVELLPGAVRVSYPGTFTLTNTYSFEGPSMHTSAFSRAQPCTLEVTAEPRGFVVMVPQSGKGLLKMSHFLRGERCCVAIVVTIADGTEPVRINRVYDRAA